MNELKIFENEQFGLIRAVEMDGEPWFVAADVCRALDIKNSHDALTRLDDDEKGVVLTDTPGGKQEMNIVNEPGLYSLVLGSRKPEAKAFKRWITHEVLPTLRRTGAYSISHNVDQRGLTVDDYLRAAHITSNCRNERLPYVLGFLEQAGFSIPRVRVDCEQQGYDPASAYQYLCGWVAENAGHFHNGAGCGECYGKIEGDYAVILRPVFNKACKEAGLINRVVLGSFKNGGLLLTGAKGYGKTARVNGIAAHCVWVKLMPDSDGEVE